MLVRIYLRGGEHPTTWDEFRRFGPLATGRFDHHPDPPRLHDDEPGILYAAYRAKTCVAEVFQDRRSVDRRHREPWLAGFRLRRAARLLSLRGDWPTRAGGSIKINTGPRSACRRWSRAIHEAYPEIEGLLYASSMHANAEAVALYERAADALPERPEFNIPLSHPALLAELERMAGEIGYEPVR